MRYIKFVPGMQGHRQPSGEVQPTLPPPGYVTDPRPRLHGRRSEGWAYRVATSSDIEKVGALASALFRL